MVKKIYITENDVEEYKENLYKAEKESGLPNLSNMNKLLKDEEINIKVKNKINEAYDKVLNGDKRVDVLFNKYKIVAYRIESQKMIRIDVRYLGGE